MYKEIGKTAIAKTRYSFKKGFMQVSIGEKSAVKNELMKVLGITGRTGEKSAVKNELMKVLGITGRTYFSTVLNAGIMDISISKYQAITHLFARRGITDVWTTEEA